MSKILTLAIKENAKVFHKSLFQFIQTTSTVVFHKAVFTSFLTDSAEAFCRLNLTVPHITEAFCELVSG